MACPFQAGKSCRSASLSPARARAKLADRWKVSADVMERVWLAAQDFEMATGGVRVEIISGYRTRAEQRALSRRGRPTAPDDLSTHRSCPATGLDVALGFLPSGFLKVTWGDKVFRRGLRWGGGGPTEKDSLIPLDWGHVDRGPRR